MWRYSPVRCVYLALSYHFATGLGPVIPDAEDQRCGERGSSPHPYHVGFPSLGQTALLHILSYFLGVGVMSFVFVSASSGTEKKKGKCAGSYIYTRGGRFGVCDSAAIDGATARVRITNCVIRNGGPASWRASVVTFGDGKPPSEVGY